MRGAVASAGLALAAVMMTACGTTLSPAQQVAAESSPVGTDNGLGLSPSTAPAYGAPDATGTPTQHGTAEPTHSLAATAGGPATTKLPTAIPSVSASTSGGGKGPIEVGYAYVDAGETNAVLSGIGKGLAAADLKAEIEAYVKHVNATGGVLGRELKLVLYRASSSNSLQNIGQALCAKETQDDHVNVSLDGNYGNVVFPCMARAGVPTIYTGIDGLTTSDYRKYPLVIEPDSINLNRLATLEVQQFVEMGYKPTGLQKLGVLYYDDPTFTAGFEALKAAWAKYGVKVTAAQSFTNWNSLAELGSLEAAVQAAELRFRTQGITHVMCVETNAYLCGFFGVYADSQSYYPRYAFNSDQPLTNILANISARGLTGSVFVGWNPGQDVSSVTKMPARSQACMRFMTKQGFPTETGNEHDGALGICEAIDYLVASIKAGGSATAAGIVAGARAIAGSYTPDHTFNVGPPPDGAMTVRDGKYEASCKCFAYTSKPFAAQ
ncbi:MAG TPA: ABC transporter substrate-binding protein [Mycobacteriales bacterium]|nr:ABC transporter substrate-binding protein [Mycobacteriales bacterium]